MITSLFLFTILVVYLGLNLYSKSDKNPLPTNDYKNEPLKHNVSADEVFDLVNQEREKIGLKPLKRNTKLDEAAMMRAQDILATDDWSHEAPHSELTYQVALNKVKYYNTTKGENLAEGQWTSQNTVNSWMNSETHKDNILNSNYQDTGVATFSGTLNNNQTIITVQLFGGYIPPNYKQTDIESWEKSLNRLREILPSWENIRNSPNRYPNNKAKAERLIQIINTRISRIQAIASKMRGNQWLTNEETKYTNEDQGLYNEQEQLGNYLNSQQW